jgi:hypothetical protein
MNSYPSNKPGIDLDTFIDEIYDWVDERLRFDEFDIVNQWLKDINIKNCDIDFLLAALTITLAARSKLDYRIEFYQNVFCDLLNRQSLKETEELLAGLN